RPIRWKDKTSARSGSARVVATHAGNLARSCRAAYRGWSNQGRAAAFCRDWLRESKARAETWITHRQENDEFSLLWREQKACQVCYRRRQNLPSTRNEIHAAGVVFGVPTLRFHVD